MHNTAHGGRVEYLAGRYRRTVASARDSTGIAQVLIATGLDGRVSCNIVSAHIVVHILSLHSAQLYQIMAVIRPRRAHKYSIQVPVRVSTQSAPLQSFRSISNPISPSISPSLSGTEYHPMTHKHNHIIAQSISSLLTSLPLLPFLSFSSMPIVSYAYAYAYISLCL